MRRLFILFFLFSSVFGFSQLEYDINAPVSPNRLEDFLKNHVKYPGKALGRLSCVQVFKITIEADGQLSKIDNLADCREYFLLQY